MKTKPLRSKFEQSQADVKWCKKCYGRGIIAEYKNNTVSRCYTCTCRKDT